jgi:hypothetical protein
MTSQVLLDIADRLGIIVLDENRVLATQENCQGPGCTHLPTYTGDPAADMGALVSVNSSWRQLFFRTEVLLKEHTYYTIEGAHVLCYCATCHACTCQYIPSVVV